MQIQGHCRTDESLRSPSVLQWNEYAKDVPPHRPPFDGCGHITGHNLFVSAYHGFTQLGNEHIPGPEKWRPFPIFFPELLSVEVRTEKLVLKIKSNIQNPGNRHTGFI